MEKETMLISEMYNGYYFQFLTGNIVYQLDYLLDGVAYYHNVDTGKEASKSYTDTDVIGYLPNFVKVL